MLQSTVTGQTYNTFSRKCCEILKSLFPTDVNCGILHNIKEICFSHLVNREISGRLTSGQLAQSVIVSC